MSELILGDANFNLIEACATIILLGKRRRGKTTWAKLITQYLSKTIDRFVSISGNKDNQAEWGKVIAPLYTWLLKTDMSALKNLIKYQDTKVSPYTNQDLPVPRKYKLGLIIDDCGSNTSFMNSSLMQDIMANGRHYGITVIIPLQYFYQLLPKNREQIDYVGMLHTRNVKNIKKVYDEMINMMTLAHFKHVLEACTASRGLCWIDNTGTPDKFEDFIYYRRFPYWPYKFETVGSGHVREFHQKHYLTPTIKNHPRAHGNKPSMFPVEDADTESSDDDSVVDMHEHLLTNRRHFTDQKTGSTFTVRMRPTKDKED